MKKIYNVFTLLVVALMGLSLAACSNDNLDTNQYKGEVSLNVYGPSPVMRGGTLRFLGSNLDQVREVIIPDGISITNIEVKQAGVPSEIRVTVPKDGPVPGKVVLVTNTDLIITTKTDLKYTESIVITSIPLAAMPGDVIKIEGDYLNLVQSLAFADNVLVSMEDFKSHSRYAIEVEVPEEAKTGKLALYTADLTVVDKNSVDYQIIETESAIEIGVPTIHKLKGRNEAEALGNITAKAGETITITGTYLQLTDDITIGGISADDLKITNDDTDITFTLPAEAPDGDILLVCKSGIEVPVGTLTTVKPTNCVATPNPVKAGQALQIDGKDMDLVTDVVFADSKGEYTIANNQNIINTKQAYAVTVPETATEGNLKLAMANGAQIDVPFTLVKPTVTGYNSTSVSAGGTVTINGTNLDLVKKVQFGESDVVNVEGTADAITLSVPMNATSGAPVLTLANGTTVANVPEITIQEAVFCYITEMPVFDDDTTPDAGDIFAVPVANGDKLTNVLVNGTEVNFVLSEKNGTLTFGIPADATSTSVVKLISSNGEIEYKISVKPATTKTKVILTGPVSVGSWSNNITIPVDAFKDLPEGKVTMVMYYAVEADGAKIKFNDGHWKNIKLEGCVGDSEYFFEFDPNETKAYVPLSAEDIAHLTDPSILDWGGSMFINGQNVTFNKIELEIELPQEKDIAGLVKTNAGTDITYPFTFTWSAVGQINLTKELLTGMGVKKGSKFLVYKSASEKGQVQINNSSWTAVYTIADWDPSKEVLEQEFDDAMMEALNGGGFWIQGDLAGVTKIAILP